MGISIFKKARGLKEEIDIKEAHNIWSMLRARYHSVDTLKIFKDITHDRDFVIVLGGLRMNGINLSRIMKIFRSAIS